MVVKMKNKEVLIDDEDYSLIKQFAYYVTTNNYVRRSTGQTHVSLATDLLREELQQAPKNALVDHINRNTLDNRRCNLRVATPAQNNSNAPHVLGRSKFRGVSHYKNYRHTAKPWCARISVNTVRIHLGLFKDAVAAARAYDAAAKKYHGEFAVLNFPDNATL